MFLYNLCYAKNTLETVEKNMSYIRFEKLWFVESEDK